MGWILVTNDDGIDAPALPALAAAVSAQGEVRVVAPARERSWVGKAITRFDPVSVDQVDRAGMRMFSVGGFPADCVQLAIHTLFDSPPDLVVSGINLGFNHGTAYVESSGTVGAAVEAGIAGVPGLAASTGTLGTPWEEWRPWAVTSEAAPMWERLAAVVADMAGGMLESAAPGTVVNVNLPNDAGPGTERRETTVAPVGYDRLFREESPGLYVHSYGGGLRSIGPMNGTDVDAARDGVISVSAISTVTTIALSQELANSLAISD